MCRYVHDKRTSLKELSELFKADIVDIGQTHVTIELVAWPKRIDAVIEIAKPCVVAIVCFVVVVVLY